MTASCGDELPPAIGELSAAVQDVVDLYIELASALVPKRGPDTGGRTSTKVHAPSPVDEETVEARADLALLIRQAKALQAQAQSVVRRTNNWLASARAHIRDLAPYETPVYVGQCPKAACGGALTVDDNGDLVCGSAESSHAIPRALFPQYYLRGENR